MILASTSPRRRRLLQEHGYEFSVIPPDVAEIAPPHLTPGEIVLFNARSKSEAVAAERPDALVLGVDTLVACGGRVFGKPTDMDDALAMLKRLNGRAHEVFSGVWLTRPARQQRRGLVEVTRVHFRQLPGTALREYLARISPLDKAGAYAAQDDNGELIERVDGSLTNVIGLPMEALAEALREFA